MMRLDEGGLLEALHEGMFQQPLWHGFLERLQARTRALYTSLVFRAENEEAVTELHAGPPTPPHLDRLFDEKYSRDPLPYRRMREGRVYAMEELVESGGPALVAYRDDFLLPLGVRSIRSVRVAEPGGVDAWLSCAGDRAVGSAAGALLAALVPHLRIALRSFMTLERERARAGVTSAVFRRMNFGWVTLDSRCRIMDLTPDVERLLHRTQRLRRGRYDRLTPASPAIDRELTATVRRFAEEGEGKPRAINLSRDPWMDMLVAPAPDRTISAAARPAAIVYLRGDRSSQADRHEELVDLFGLLPSEARLAWAMAQGLSIAQAARELDLTVETARNYSKKIYAKTGARGQADLVRTILTGVLALA
jgi:DNA-binding CsgD family transcriptional regulator